MLEKLEFDVSRDKDGGTIMRVVDSDDSFDITIEKTKAGSVLATDFLHEHWLNRRYRFLISNFEVFVRSIKTLNDVEFDRDIKEMFRGCYNLERLDLTNSYMSKVKNMASLCFHLENLKEVSMCDVDLSSVETANNMFACCSSLVKADFSNSDLSGAREIVAMFSTCDRLKYLNINGLDLDSVTEAYCFAADCSSLEDLTIGCIGSRASMEYSKEYQLFNGCSRLKGIKVNRFADGNDIAFEDIQLVRNSVIAYTESRQCVRSADVVKELKAFE